MLYKKTRTVPVAVVLLMTSEACTGQIPGSFRFKQQTQTFSASLAVNTKIDLLWVVDNSSSMDVHQKKLRDGFVAFANQYLKPTWDIRVAVIPTDTFLAQSSYSTYLSQTISGSTGYTSSYLSGVAWLAFFQNPASDLSLVDTSNGSFPHGITYNQLNPLWGPTYSLLKPGIHDGPIQSFCFEGMPFFLNGVTQCSIRDNPFGNLGVDHCINPDTGAGESSLSQCINTTQNDTVRTGKAIISTLPPSGTAGDLTWISQLSKDFMVNASVGSSGSGSERGFSSVLQLLTDNEASNTAFFRPDSLRGIIFLSDEDDQSLALPSPLPAGFSPDWGYGCDLTSLMSLNGNSALVNGSGGLCCSDPLNNCKYGSLSTSCTPKTVDGFTYTLGVCVDPLLLIPVATVKQTLDSFFKNLDSSPTGNPNYFIATITPTTGTAVQAVQSSRTSINTALGTLQVIEADRGDRYIALGNLVGNGSLALDLTESDYTPVLNAIGNEIVQKKSTYTLTRAPTSQEDMIVSVIHENDSSTVVSNSKYSISGKSIIFNDASFVLSLSSTDKVSINYQPKTAY